MSVQDAVAAAKAAVANREDPPKDSAEQSAPHLDATKISIPVGMSMQQMMEEFQRFLEARSAAAAASSEVEAAPPRSKTYFHSVPGSTIVICRRGANGENIPEFLRFSNVDGHLTTQDPEIQAALDPLVAAPYAPVWEKEDQAHNEDAETALAVVLDQAAKSSERLGAEAAGLLKGVASTANIAI